MPNRAPLHLLKLLELAWNYDSTLNILARGIKFLASLSALSYSILRNVFTFQSDCWVKIGCLVWEEVSDSGQKFEWSLTESSKFFFSFWYDICFSCCIACIQFYLLLGCFVWEEKKITLKNADELLSDSEKEDASGFGYHGCLEYFFYDLAEITCVIKTACVLRLITVSNMENNARQCLLVKGGICTILQQRKGKMNKKGTQFRRLAILQTFSVT